MTPSPGPTPLYVVVEQAAGGTEWASPGVLVPLTVALVALGGVVWSTWHNARAGREAEDRRADTAIEAENRRADAAIQAEDRRHEHAIEAERQRHVIEARQSLYVRLESTRRALLDELPPLSLKVAIRAHGPGLPPASIEVAGMRATVSQGPVISWKDLADVRRALDDFGAVRREAGLYASRAVEEHAEALWQAASTLGSQVREREARTREQVGADFERCVENTKSAASDLQTVLRLEIGSES